MPTRRQRLSKLVSVQEQLKAFHEARHAGLVAGAASAGQEARELAGRFDDPDSLASLFPEVYHAGIAAALHREAALTRKAESAADDVAVANARGNMVERNYRREVVRETRETEDRERLEMIQNRRPVSR